MTDKQINNNEKVSIIHFLDHTIKEIKYGKIELTIHDSKVVQVDKTEKFRFSNLTL